MPLTATKLPDGEMYLQEENKHQRCTGKTHSSGCQCKEWYDFNYTHPPILALFKCTEGQRFEEGEVELVWQSHTKQLGGWTTINKDAQLSRYKNTRQVYTLKSDKGGEVVEGKKEIDLHLYKTAIHYQEDVLIISDGLLSYIELLPSEIVKLRDFLNQLPLNPPQL